MRVMGCVVWAVACGSWLIAIRHARGSRRQEPLDTLACQVADCHEGPFAVSNGSALESGQCSLLA